MKKQLLTVIPKNFSSWLTGAGTRLKCPQFILQGFVKTFGIDMSEAQYELTHYKTIEDVFTRKLKPSARSIEGDICMPCDGKTQWNGPVSADSEIIAKDLTYSIRELIYGADAQSSNIDPRFAQVIYLAPHNYHRVHTPVSGVLKKIRHLPGPLWPVSPDFVAKRPALLAENERMVFEIDVDQKGAKVWVVMVGAYNVGRIQPAIDTNFLTNNGPLRSKTVSERSYEHKLEKGDELGTFMLGSTTVTIFNKAFCDQYSIRQLPENQIVRLGENLIATS